jgi:peptidoglycan lytic transglycosylase
LGTQVLQPQVPTRSSRLDFRFTARHLEVRGALFPMRENRPIQTNLGLPRKPDTKYLSPRSSQSSPHFASGRLEQKMHGQGRTHLFDPAGRRLVLHNILTHNCLWSIGRHRLRALWGVLALASCCLGAAALAQDNDAVWTQTGVASWYGPGFAGRPTASGETYDPSNLTAAHPTLPLGSLVRVHNLDNDRNMIVRINDRGPFARGRIIDVSRAAADVLGFRKDGTTKVRLTKVAPPPGRNIAVSAASAAPSGEDTAPPAPKEPAPAFVTESSLRPPPAAAPTKAAVSTAATPNPTTTAAATSGGAQGEAPLYFVQIGAFRDERGAQELLQNSGSLGMALQVGFSENLYRVLAGPFENSDAAEVVTRELARSGKTAFVRKHP